jgi:dihydrolipoamide dehydrogenase
MTRVAVVGAGPGGYAAAFYAADLGMEVALIDPERNPGGVCLYRGCIPSKALLHVAKVIDEAGHAKAWGIEFGEPRIDVNRLRAYKDKVVEKLTSGTGQVARLRKVRYLQGWATIVTPTRLQVRTSTGDETVDVDNIVLATGSEPTRLPALSINSPRVLDSTSALDLPGVPGSLLVIGGGYIGLELGSVYAALGSRVSVVEMTDGLLPGADRDLVRPLAQRVEQTFERVMVSTRVLSMKAVGNTIAVALEGPNGASEAAFDYVLVAIGRRPNARIPGIEKTRVQVTDRGFIQTDFQRRTEEPTIFAIGDVAGEPMLAHKASHEARVAIEAIAGHKAIFEPQAIPAVVFTDPEIAWAGLTETQAQKEGRQVDVAKFPWGASGRAISIDRVDGLTKLIFDAKTERVLGIGVVGAGAGELISEGVLAIEMGATASDIKLTIHPHPTLSETVMEAAEQFFGTATHVYKPKRK